MRKAFGAFYVLAGTALVGINAFMLWNGAQLVGSSQNEKVALGLFGGILAFFIAAQTITMSEFFRPVRLFWVIPMRLPHLSSVGLWLLFLAVNLITGLGTIGHARNASIAQAKQHATTATNTVKARARYEADLAALPQARPTETVQADIDKARITKAFLNSDDCRDVSTKDRRTVCQQIEALKGELAVSKQRAVLNAKLEEKDETIAESSAVVEAAAETQVAGLERALRSIGFLKDGDKDSVRENLNTLISAMWPVALEAGAAYSWHQGFFLLGLTMAATGRRKPEDDDDKAMEANDNDKPATGKLKALASRAQPSTPPATVDQLRRDRQLVEWFWANRTRPVPAGSMTEDQWYDLYCETCRGSGATPVVVDWMRRIAIEHGVKVRLVGEGYVYFGVLPASEAAA